MEETIRSRVKYLIENATGSYTAFELEQLYNVYGVDRVTKVLGRKLFRKLAEHLQTANPNEKWTN